MNTEMTRLLAARLGLSPEESNSLQTDRNPAKLLASRLAERCADPLLGSLLSSMFREDPEPPEERVSDIQSQAHANKTIEKLQQNLAAADTMARYIADTFGACQLCWGLNRLCSQCGGNGKPGSREPQAQEMLAWVEPALARLGLKVTTG